MILLITVLIVLISVVLAFFVLVQSPKGGGLTGNFGTLSTQVMGVKQSSDVMERGTWTTMGLIAALCIVSIMFVARPAASNDGTGKQKQTTGGTQKQAAPAPATPKK